MVAMSGAIMPAPLAMPLMVTVALPMRARRGRHLGKGVGGHDRLGRGEEIARPCARRRGRPSRGANLDASSGSPITPVEARKISAGLQPCRLGGDFGGELGGGAPALAGEGIGVAGIDHQRARFAGLEMRAAPFDRRRRAFRAGEHAGHGGAGVEQRQQHVGAAGIADAGLRRWRAARRRSPAGPARVAGRGGRWRWT